MSTKSYTIEAQGNGDLWANIKDNSRGIVRVETDDSKIDLAHVLDSNDPKRLKIGWQRHDRQRRGRRWKSVIQSVVGTIDRSRIRDIVQLGGLK